MTNNNEKEIREEKIELFGFKIFPIQRLYIFIFSLGGIIIPLIVPVSIITALMNVFLTSSSYSFDEVFVRIIEISMSIIHMICLFFNQHMY
ncbi:MAG: hypothetical protein BAJALOKI2v1_130011 [Promethearchaeota archaeon]|nr:MAG: hypothetical protein BAJALOKI2v1_130011 [Candidatus Lokiarchaeota archaeon]